MLRLGRDRPASPGALLVLGAVFAYLWIYLPLLPASGAPWGHDYSLHLPNLLAGQFWFANNGPFAVPWFNPGQCAGVPFFGDLNVAYYSLPQWASFLTGPVAAVRLTLVAFSALGAWGFYLLVRGPFAASAAAAAVAAVLFLFSGFFSYRMAVGHMTFHPFTLVPWLAWVLLGGGLQVAGRWRWLWPVAAGGAVLAYMFHGGMIHGIPPAVMSVGAILLLHGQLRGHRRQPWLWLLGAAGLALLLGAQRLAAALAFVEHFPRDEYPLPGFASLADALGIVLRSLFWRPPAAEAGLLLVNVTVPLERHEWEYGVGPAAALLLLAGAASFAHRRAAWRPSAAHWLVVAALCLAFALPILLNWHQPAWHEFLKGVPVLGSSSNLVRWFVFYVPVIALAAALAFDRVVPAGRWSLPAALLVAAATIAWQATADHGHYTKQDYSAAAIQQAARALREGRPVPAVTHLSVRTDNQNRLLLATDRNDDIALGYSQLLCYQPMFGYGLERLRHGALQPGPALADLGDGTLNLKNPVCYQFPRENGCAPGDHFRIAQREEAARFLRYEPFAFRRSWRQHAADAATLAALLFTLGALAAAAVLARRERLSAGARPAQR
jgi:hypothetical protein